MFIFLFLNILRTLTVVIIGVTFIVFTFVSLNCKGSKIQADSFHWPVFNKLTSSIFL